MLHSFETGIRAAVIGASGGIGRAVTNLLVTDPHVDDVRVFSRAPIDAGDGISAGYELDLTDETSIANAAEEAADGGAFDLVLVTTGTLHRGEDFQPEKSLRDIDATAMSSVFAVNTIGPALVAKHFLPRMRRNGKSVFAALSARVGSISDNRLGGWVSYRTSKAALNMVLKTLAIEHARRFPDSIIAALHPGTVDTALSRPFTGRTPEAQLFDPPRSARRLLDVVDTLTPADTGGFFAWDGQAIPY